MLLYYQKMEYQIGDRVERIENRDVTAATVIDVQKIGDDTILQLEYDDGGNGWWPSSAVRPLTTGA